LNRIVWLFSFWSVLQLGLVTPVSASSSDSTFVYNLNGNGLTQEQVVAVQAFLQLAWGKLPATVRERIHRAVEVRFVSDPGAAGRIDSSHQRIILNQNFLAEILKGPSAAGVSPTAHQNLYIEALATVLHETTHLYDNILSPDQQLFLSQCEDSVLRNSRLCLDARAMPTYLSSEPSFQMVSGWYGSNFRMSWREPDVYESSDVRETLAVNMEYFLLDPHFQCRRPTLYRYLRTHFQHTPFLGVTCDSVSVAINAEGTSSDTLTETIPFDRVYEIDYLMASAGSAIESRLGHSMLRLVVCPVGAPVDENCRKNVSQHLVLSFRGSVTDIHQSLWKGLFGGYPSRLFVMNLSRIVREYAQDQFRDLTAYPLRLTAEEKMAVLQRALEYHWSYHGQYYFVTNNCAVETRHLVASALVKAKVAGQEENDERTENLALADSLTPKGVLGDLADAGLASETPESTDPQSGMFFASYMPHYQAALQKIANLLPPGAPFRSQESSVSETSVQSWFYDYSSAQRRAMYQSILDNPLHSLSGVEKRSIDAAFYLLEVVVSRLAENVDANNAAEALNQRAQDPNLKASDPLQNLLNTRDQLINPGSFAKSPAEYGLPTSSELAQTLQAMVAVAESQGASDSQIDGSIDQFLTPDAIQELRDLGSNVNFYQQQLKTDLK